MCFYVHFLMMFYFFWHPMHVSVTNLEFLQHEKKIIISFKFFTDDLEKALSAGNPGEINLSGKSSIGSYDEIFTRYIADCFVLFEDGENLMDNKLKFVKTEKNTESTWLFFDYNDVSAISDIEIENKLLLDLYHDQVNLMIVVAGDFEKGYELNTYENMVKIPISHLK